MQQQPLVRQPGERVVGGLVFRGRAQPQLPGLTDGSGHGRGHCGGDGCQVAGFPLVEPDRASCGGEGDAQFTGGAAVLAGQRRGGGRSGQAGRGQLGRPGVIQLWGVHVVAVQQTRRRPEGRFRLFVGAVQLQLDDVGRE